MLQETMPSPLSDTAACAGLSAVADAHNLWSSLDDTSLRRSAASESSKFDTAHFSSEVEAEEDAMWAGLLGLPLFAPAIGWISRGAATDTRTY